MKTVQKTVRISNISQAAPVNGRPGNLIINRQEDANKNVMAHCWFSSREFRNALLGAGFSPLIPVSLFQYATIHFTQLTIEPEDVAGGQVAKFTFPGKNREGTGPRVVEYKQAGIHNINMTLDLGSMSPDQIITISDLSMKHNIRNQQRFGGGGAQGSQTMAPVEQLQDDEVAAPNGVGTAADKLLASQTKPAPVNLAEGEEGPEGGEEVEDQIPIATT